MKLTSNLSMIYLLLISNIDHQISIKTSLHCHDHIEMKRQFVINETKHSLFVLNNINYQTQHETLNHFNIHFSIKHKRDHKNT